MNKQAARPSQPAIDAVMHPETPAEHIAYWISNIFSPPVIGLAVLVIASWGQPHPDVWQWVIAYVLLALFIPFGFLLWQLKRGAISDIEIYHREQRSGSLLITAVGSALAGTVLALIQAPAIYLLISFVSLLIWLSVYLITLRWKISVHSASATACTLLIVHAVGWHFYPLLLIIPAVAWSRIRLRKHTPLQTLGGTILATSIFLIVLAGLWFFS